MREDTPPSSQSRRSVLSFLRTSLGLLFVAAYLTSAFALEGTATVVFLLAGSALYAASLPRAAVFHKALAVVAFVTLSITVATGRFEPAEVFAGLPTYLGIVAVLLVLSVAGYPIRAARYEGQIRAFVGAMSTRGFGPRITSGAFGHVLGTVLDVGTFVLVDVILRRSVASYSDRVEALAWTARMYSLAPLWANTNLLTATAIMLTGASYPALFAVTFPFAILILLATILVARRSEVEKPPTSVQMPEPLDRRVLAVLCYPLVLIVAVASVSTLLPSISMTFALATTVTVIVVLLGVLASFVIRSLSPLYRLSRETHQSLVYSHNEFALFGSAGILVLSLTQLGALSPLGTLLSALPERLVPFAIAIVVGGGFLVGVHVIPMVLLIDTAFPLANGPAPVLWAAAIMLGAQSALLATPFSNAVTMLSRLSSMHPLKVGPAKNWRFAASLAAASLAYLALITFVLI